MVFCKKRNIIFVHIPKTAGTSVESFLSMMNGQCGYGVVNGKAHQHFLWHDYKQKFGKDYDKYFKFTICRNPYTRFVSEYHWCQIPGKGARGGQTVDQFIDFCRKKIESNDYSKTIYDDHIIPQWKYAYNNNEELMIDYVGKFEKLPAVVGILRRKYNIKENFPFAHKNGSKKVVLTSEQKEKVYNIYKKDFELFGYEK